MEKKSQPQVISAIVRQVSSGDHIVLFKSSKQGLGKEIPVYLAQVQAPKMGSTNRTEEPFAFDAREFLREKIVGKKCEFTIDYNYAGRDYGVLVVNGENLNLAIVRAGLAKVLEKKGNAPQSQYYEDLLAAQKEASKNGLGVWSTQEKHIEKHTRLVTYFSDPGFNAARLFEESKGTDKPLESIIEYVFSPSFISAFVHRFSAVVKVSMVHLFTPSNTDKAILAEGKQFTEKLLLSRTVGIKFDRVEEGGTFVGRIYHPAGDIAYEVLKNGYSKLNPPKNIDFDAEYYKTLKEAQLIAQSKNSGIWKDFKKEESKTQAKASTGDFEGKVVEIHSGDSLTVQRDSDHVNFRVFFATVKAPVMITKDKGDPEPWAWESKEALRKLTIGKKVKVVMEFSKTVQNKTGEGKDRNMDFASVFLTKNNKNVAAALLEKGLLKTSLTKSGDNASKFLEDLLAAEKKASDQKVGVHSSQQAPIRVFNDLVQNSKKSKDFEAIVMKRPNRKLNGIVEYCFSGMRFKVRLDGENTAIAFNLQGVKTMANDKNQPQMLEFSNLAQEFAKETLFQKDVTIEIDFADKRGTFFGTLWHNQGKQDFAVELTQEGLAQVSLMGSKIPQNLDKIEEAQENAKADQLGIWGKGMKLVSQSSPTKVKKFERIQIEMTDITDASRFFIKILGDNQYSKIESELNKFDALAAEDLERPIKRGTLCAAKFDVDKKWYRAKVLGASGKGHYDVEFIDFGNTETAAGDELKRLPQSLLKYEPQAKQCNLAYIKVPHKGDLAQEAAKLVKKTAFETISEAIVAGQEGDRLSIVLFEKGEKDWNNSVNAVLVAEGLASMNVTEEDAAEEINDWYNFEEEAKENQLKIWEYGGANDDSD